MWIRTWPANFATFRIAGWFPARQIVACNHGFVAGGANQPFYIFRITCKNDCLVAQCNCYDNGVNHIGCSGLSQQAPRGVRIVLAERHDRTANQEAAQLGLLRGPADLALSEIGYKSGVLPGRIS